MTQLDQLVIELRADITQVTASMNAVSRQLGQLNSQVSRSQSQVTTSFATMTRAGAGFAAGFLTIGKAVDLAESSFQKIVRSSRDLQSLDARFKAITGSSLAAGEALDFIRRTAERQSVDVLDLADGYARLIPVVNSGAVTMGEMRRILELTNDNMKAFGLDAANVQDLFYGLSQVLGSGTVTMEDLRQVTDRLPGSLQAIAERLNGSGGTVAGLKAMVSTGQLTAQELKGPLLTALGLNAGAAEKMGTTFDSASTRMGNSVRDLAAAIGDSTGIISTLSGAMTSIAEAANYAAERINIMMGNLQKVKLSSLTDEAADLSLQMKDVSARMKELEGNGPLGSAIAEGSRQQALAGLRKELAGLQTDYDKVKQAMSQRLPGEVAPTKTKPSVPATLSAESKQAAKDAGSLAEKMNDLLLASQRDLATDGMDEIQRAAFEAKAAVADLVAQYGKLTPDLQQKADEIVRNAVDKATNKRNERLQDEYLQSLESRSDEVAEAMNKPFENAAQGIQTTFTNTFEGIFDGSINSASDAADAIKGVFFKMAAEIATLAIFGPELSGLSSGGIKTGSGSLSSSSGMLSLLKDGLSKSLLGDSVTSGLNSFGADFGFGSLGTGIGKIATGGNLLSGFAGSYLGSALFGSSTAGSVGSSLGGLAGAAFGGPLGAGIGSFLGAGIGGAFSGPRPHPASTFGTQGVFGSPLDLQSKHMDTEFASTLADALKNALSSLSGAGVNLSFIRSLQGGVNDGTGFLSFGDSSVNNPLDTVQFDPSSSDAGLAKFLKLVIDQAGDLSGIMDAELIPALRNLSTEGKTSAQVIAEITDMLTRDDQRRTMMASVNQSLLEQLLPGFSAMSDEMAAFEANLEQARKLGASQQEIARITLDHQLKVKALQAENNEAQQEAIAQATDLVRRYGQVSTGFGNLISELRNGRYTTMSPVANLGDLRSQVLSVGSAARLGDASAQEQLLTLLPQFLDLSAEVNGFNTEFAKDQGIAADLAEEAKSVADRQLAIQQELLESSNSALGYLETIAGKGTGGNANDKLVAALNGGYAGLSNAMIDSIFQSAGVTVAPGEGRRTNFLNANADVNEKLNAIFHALGVPGFATGGWITGGMAGRDSVPLIGMPGEYVLRANAAAALGAPALDFMNATGRLPSNDNGTSVSALSSRIDRLTDVVYAMGQAHTEHLAGIRASSARTANQVAASGW